MPVIGKGRPSQLEEALQARLDALESSAGEAGVPLAALRLPAYMLNALPAAADWDNGIVRIIDNPQGTATSNGVVWISDVDGSNLGPGSAMNG